MIKSADFGFEAIWKVERPMGVDVPSDIGEFVSGAAALLWSFATRGWFVWTPDDTFLMPGRDVQRTDLDWLEAEAKRSHKRREVEEG